MDVIDSVVGDKVGQAESRGDTCSSTKCLHQPNSSKIKSCFDNLCSITICQTCQGKNEYLKCLCVEDPRCVTQPAPRFFGAQTPHTPLHSVAPPSMPPASRRLRQLALARKNIPRTMKMKAKHGKLNHHRKNLPYTSISSKSTWIRPESGKQRRKVLKAKNIAILNFGKTARARSHRGRPPSPQPSIRSVSFSPFLFTK